LEEVMRRRIRRGWRGRRGRKGREDEKEGGNKEAMW
jgi:hypothetical protein